MKNKISNEIVVPEFILVGKAYNLEETRTCECCGRDIHNVNIIKNTHTNEVKEMGTGCTLKTLGKSVREIEKDTENYEKELKKLKNAEAERERKIRFVETFKEANPEMLQYIENNVEIPFINSMKERLEEYGTLTNSMFYAVYCMMLPDAKLDSKVQNLLVKPIRFTKKEGNYGSFYTLFAETENKELIKIHFSSINKKNKELFIEKGIIDDKDDICDDIYRKNIKLVVSGNYDGYKIKRAKIEEA
jgi:hypothetical protein